MLTYESWLFLSGPSSPTTIKFVYELNKHPCEPLSVIHRTGKGRLMLPCPCTVPRDWTWLRKENGKNTNTETTQQSGAGRTVLASGESTGTRIPTCLSHTAEQKRLLHKINKEPGLYRAGSGYRFNLARSSLYREQSSGPEHLEGENYGGRLLYTLSISTHGPEEGFVISLSLRWVEGFAGFQWV